MSFRENSMSSGGLDGTPGFMIKQGSAPHATQLPAWQSTTEIRIFPAPMENGGWYPMRNSVEVNDFGPAVEVEPACRKLGVIESFTYVTRIPGGVGDDPTTKLCRALVDTAENSPHDLPREWCEWTKGGPGRAAKVQKVQSCIFFQAAAMTIKGKPCKNMSTGKIEPRFPILFMGSLSLMMTFSRLGNSIRANADGTPLVEFPAEFPKIDNEVGRQQFDDICAQSFELGDWCSPEHGRVMKIFQAEAGPNERPHYDIEMLEEKPLSPQMLGRVRAFWTPWSKLLRYHTAEEQISYLKRAFPIEVLDFALGRSEYEGMLPEGAVGSWQRLQQRMSGAWSPGLPAAAQQQLPQTQQLRTPVQTHTTTTPTTNFPPAEDDGWGSGDSDIGNEEVPATAGPSFTTPAEFKAASPATNAAPTATAMHTPAEAVRGQQVDPAALAATLELLHSKVKKSSPL